MGPFLLAATLLSSAFAANVQPVLNKAHRKDWRFPVGQWSLAGGVLTQADTTRLGSALLLSPAFSDFDYFVDFRISSQGNGVRAAALIFHATGTLSYYWVHLDSQNGNVIMTRSEPGRSWIEIGRKPCAISQDVWHTAEVVARGKHISVRLDGKEIYACDDGSLAAGRVGVGTSQGRVEFRNIHVEGTVVSMAPLKNEQPPYQIISRGPEAGTYQAFPDACRLHNGDILVVFYAGYTHVSLPTKEWPKGGRICMVRSHDEGKTWSKPAILYDDALDNRDPHIAQLADGTVVCSFFSLRPKKGGGWDLVGVQMVKSHDGGKTWPTKAETLVPGWACSAPVRQLPDGICLQGIYCEHGDRAWGGVIRSTDGGKTWSAPIPIGENDGVYLDAETDVIRLKDGRIFAALRSSKVDEHYAISDDEGLTWSHVHDIGFRGHSPHLNRLRNGTILLVQRLPDTAMYISRDDTKTWQGPYIIDHVGGAYPSTVELKDGTVLCVYYEEGEGSAIRAAHLKITPTGIEHLPW